MKHIILASESPRRKALFSKFNLPFTCASANIDETLDLSLNLEDAVSALAHRKAYAVFKDNTSAFVIGADTIVTIDNRVLGKPKDKTDAVRMLKMLSGKTHKVITGICMLSDNIQETFCDVSCVTFYPLTDDELYAYVDTGEPLDKAGAYGIQGAGALLIKGIEGDFYSVMGLPVARVYRSLRRCLPL